MAKELWVYYSAPVEGSNKICVLDFSHTGWREVPGEGHMKYRTLFPNSIIHCKKANADGKKWLKRCHTGIRYHMGET